MYSPEKEEKWQNEIRQNSRELMVYLIISHYAYHE